MPSKINIPLVDLPGQYKLIKKEVDKVISDLLSKGEFIGGEQVQKFAIEFANICNTPYCIPCANGTDAIEIALQALGIGKNDEVIIPAFSFVATLEAVCNVNAIPVFCDVDPVRLTLDPIKLTACITEKTKAIIPVHLYGQMADMDPIMAISKKHKLFVVEDSAQAHKAEYKGFLSGSIGHFGTFSFYPGKTLGAYGDAGALTTNDEQLHNKAYKIANHGRASKYEHDIIGRNSRMDSIQAAVLRIKLKYIDEWTKARRRLAYNYHKLLLDITEVTTPVSFAESESVFHLYVIRVDRSVRDGLRKYLEEAGIETGIHYPVALTKLTVTKKQLKIKANCPEAEKASQEVLSLPLYPELTAKQQKYICEQIKKFYSAPHHHSEKSLIHASNAPIRK